MKFVPDSRQPKSLHNRLCSFAPALNSAVRILLAKNLWKFKFKPRSSFHEKSDQILKRTSLARDEEGKVLIHRHKKRLPRKFPRPEHIFLPLIISKTLISCYNKKYAKRKSCHIWWIIESSLRHTSRFSLHKCSLGPKNGEKEGRLKNNLRHTRSRQRTPRMWSECFTPFKWVFAY